MGVSTNTPSLVNVFPFHCKIQFPHGVLCPKGNKPPGISLHNLPNTATAPLSSTSSPFMSGTSRCLKGRDPYLQALLACWHLASFLQLQRIEGFTSTTIFQRNKSSKVRLHQVLNHLHYKGFIQHSYRHYMLF